MTTEDINLNKLVDDEVLNELKGKTYQNLADCIRSDQLSAKQVALEMEADPEFKEWYSRKYLIKNIYQ